MPKTHEEIKEIIRTAKDENDARIKMYKWGMDRGYSKSVDESRERFLTNALMEPLEDILENPNVLWGREKCKDSFKANYGIEIDSQEGNEYNKMKEEKLIERQVYKVLSFEQFCKQYHKPKDVSLYDIIAYISSQVGSDVFNVYLQTAKHDDIPHFSVVKNPGFIAGHTEQFVKENEHRLSHGEKVIYCLIRELCEKYGINKPEIPVEDPENELWTAIEYDELEICGWLCINKKTKKSYIIKIS